jgi:hypothetical protein
MGLAAYVHLNSSPTIYLFNTTNPAPTLLWRIRFIYIPIRPLYLVLPDPGKSLQTGQ